MTDNLDQFDQSPDFEDAESAAPRGGFGQNLANAWRTKPVFKIIVVLLGLGALVTGVVILTTSKPKLDPSFMQAAPGIKEAPGGKASPAFIEAQAKANEQRIQEAVAANETALPTPLPTGINVDSRKETDPLVEFRAEMQRQKEEQQKQIAQLQTQTQQVQQVTVQQDQQQQQALATSLQAQLQKLAELWKPQTFQVVSGVEGAYGAEAAKRAALEAGTDAPSAATGLGSAAPPNALNNTGNASTNGTTIVKKQKPLIAAGTVNYAQMLTEANSDVPGPILAQIVSGPLSGARAIGQFRVDNDLMTLEFKTAILKGKEYKIEALALDPNTTLGGMATDVDHRYFSRLVLPAAASFISALGQKLSEKPATVTVTPNGTTVTDQGRTGIKDGLYAGVGSAGSSVAGFFTDQAGKTKVLVRVEVGTPMGLFFISAVCGGEFPCSNETADNRFAEATAPVAQPVKPATPVATPAAPQR
jgi:intracellular multiplication protein IcmE